MYKRQGVGITVMKGYAGGRLFQAETSPFGVALTPVQCLHYALTRPAVASVMAGFDTPEHVDAAVAYETATEEEKDYASVLASAPKHAYSGQCTYCGHCAPCPVRIDIAMVNKLYDLAAMQEEVPATVKAHYEQLSANAGDCVQCGGCESRCPFGVRIVDRMKKTRELFGEMCIRDRNLAGTQVAFVKISRGLLRCDSLGHSRIFCSLQLCPHPFLQGAVVIYDACNPDGGVFRNGLYNPQLFIRSQYSSFKGKGHLGIFKEVSCFFEFICDKLQQFRKGYVIVEN